MPIVSYLDPQFDFELVTHTLNDIEEFIDERKANIKTEYDTWIKNNPAPPDHDEEWRQWQEDNFVDEMFYVDELKRNLLNGLAITVNTIFERHLHFVIREIYKQAGQANKYKEKHTYKMHELKRILVEIDHPNKNKIDSVMRKRLNAFVEIRNALIHHGGTVTNDNMVVKQYISANKRLFVLEKNILRFSITPEYIIEAVERLNEFFRLLVYRQDRSVLYY